MRAPLLGLRVRLDGSPKDECPMARRRHAVLSPERRASRRHDPVRGPSDGGTVSSKRKARVPTGGPPPGASGRVPQSAMPRHAGPWLTRSQQPVGHEGSTHFKMGCPRIGQKKKSSNHHTIQCTACHRWRPERAPSSPECRGSSRRAPLNGRNRRARILATDERLPSQSGTTLLPAHHRIAGVTKAPG